MTGLAGITLGALLAATLLAWPARWLLQARRHAREQASVLTADLRRLATVVEHTSNAVVGLDLGLKVLWVNAGFTRTTGWQASECIGRSIMELVAHPDADPSARAALRQAALRGEDCRMEMLNRRKDGSPLWMNVEIQPTTDASGRLTGWIEIALDISHLKRVEAMLQKREHLMRVVTDNIPARVSYWDADMRCRFVNQAFCQWFGRSREEMLDQPLSPTMFSAGQWSHLAPVIERVRTGQPQQFELDDPGPDGAHATWLAHWLPDLDPVSGQVRGVFALALDVTELKQARDVALQASQAKSQFLSSMSHELRTPMNAVLGMLALLQGTSLDARQADYARKAHGAAGALLDLLNDVLDLSKVEAGKMVLHPRPFGFEPLLRELSTMLSVQVGAKPVEVVFDLDANLPSQLLGDDVRLRQILINLCGNAIKFTECGEVRVAVRLLGQSEGLARVRLSVQDTGIGMSEDEVARLFEEFTQANAGTTRRFGGTGLGLSICQRLAGLMGTRIEVTSHSGRGSCFSMDVDLYAQASAPQRPPVQHRALVIDDNATTRAALASQLRQLGYEADVAASGEQALALWAEAGAPYAAVLLDWRLPGLEGWEGVRCLRRLPGAQASTLVVTGSVAEHEGVEAAGRGERAMLDGFLDKPATVSMLREALHATAQDLQAVMPPPRPQRLAGLRLLVAEDNALNQQIARELLEREGARVTLVANGLEAVGALREQPAGHDVVLMDLQMPLMDGLAATAQIREVLGLRALPIVAMTANAMDGDRQACLAGGMDDHVGKPFVIDRLVQVVLAQAGRAAPAHAPRDLAIVPARADAPLWDRQQALSHMAGDALLLDRVLQAFRDSLADTLRRLPGLLREQPAGEAARLLHTLKGQAATVGALPLCDAARGTEALLTLPRSEPGALEEGLRALQAAAADTLAAMAPPSAGPAQAFALAGAMPPAAAHP